MTRTEKLYYYDSYRTEFEANVLTVEKLAEKKFRTLLDKTFFYPTSGGQPYDTGFLDGKKVAEVSEIDGLIWHYTEDEITVQKVTGKIDYLRRLEHIQHHTGQHLLSQAFIRVINYPTVSFHLGREFATIEITAPELSEEDAEKVEELANLVIYENRKINVLYVDEEELNGYQLRKQPKKKCNSGDIRVIEIEDFDLSPCGGTHARSTGELGIIKITGWEKYKGHVRVEFLCGRRALKNFQLKNKLVKSISREFSTAPEKLENIFQKHLEEHNTLLKQLSLYKKDFACLKAQELLSSARQYKEFKLVSGNLGDSPPELLTLTAQQLGNSEKTVSLLAGIHDKRIFTVFCRSKDLDIDLNRFLKPALAEINGKGGGKPDFVQGSGDKTNPDRFLEKASEHLLSELTRQPEPKGNMLHLGCGDIYLDGFLNIDLDPASKADILMDITDLKFADESCSKIVAHSCFEHLTYEEADTFLQGCYRVLEKGGILDIEVPDIEEYAKKWVSMPYEEKWAFYSYIVFWGGQWTPHQLHKSGWSAAFLGNNLAIHGFKNFRSLPPLHPVKHYHMIRIVAEKADLSIEQEAKLTFMRGVEKLKRINGKGAITDFKKSLSLNPNLLDNYQHLVLTALSGFTSYEELLVHFNDILEANPGVYGPLLGIALVKLRQGNIEEAKKLYFHLFKIVPDDPSLALLKQHIQAVDKMFR